MTSIPRGLPRALAPATILSLLLGLVCQQGFANDELIRDKGAQIYSKQCAQCHGQQGQGNEDYYPDPLVGDATVGELAELISDTMPEEDPDLCVAADAAAVAAFVHHEFYSEAAQIRRRPPRAALARLTAEQLRQSLADLYGSFDGPPWTMNKRGVEGNYFDAGRWKKDKLKIERVDPVLDFDFGHEGPGGEIQPEEYYIHWAGSLWIPTTGRYEIIVRSSCSFVMDFGARDRELINNHVQSEGKEEFHRVLNLTGGRCYPFQFDVHQRKRKTEQPAAYFTVSWIPPGGVEEIIPTENLIPSGLPSTFAVQSKLPPDDRSYGYERGTSVNRTWDESTTNAALEFARIAIDELYPRYRQRNRKQGDENRNQLRKFLGQLVSTALRHPINDQEREQYIDRFVDQHEDDGDAIKMVCLYTLKSPRFLYPTLDSDRPLENRIGNRLAMIMLDSIPVDPTLTKLIENGQLDDPVKLNEVARRLVTDYRCVAKTQDFLYQWFHLDGDEEITKDDDAYAGFDQHIVADLRKSVDAFIREIVYSEASDFRQLLQADWIYTNDRLADYYGDAWQVSPKHVADRPNMSVHRSVSDPIQHVGLINHPLLMSQLAHYDATSPIHRGVFLTRQVLGRVLRPPNAAFAPLNPELHPDLTTRQRVELQTGEVSCQVCHSKINPLGYAFENFDATGRFRNTERGQAIDASGTYTDRAGQTIDFTGARELGDFLAGSYDCHRSFVESAFEHFVKQPIAAYGPDLADELTQQFQESGFHIRELIVTIAEIAAIPQDVAVAQASGET